MIDTVFVLAGGSGTRLWPASRRSRPKQFLPIRDGATLLELSLARAAALSESGEIYVITIREQVDLTVETCVGSAIDSDRIALIPEPCARNTAPAISVAARLLELQGRTDERILVLAADHMIEPQGAFASDVSVAAGLADAGYLVTFGIPPVRADTGFGYIEAGERVGGGMKVVSFKEKPDRPTAERYLRTGRYFWNSGMFAFTVGTFLDELRSGDPRVFDAIAGLDDIGVERRLSGIRTVLGEEALRPVYESAPSISVDCAVMEHSPNVAVVPASFSWNDVGSWDEFAAISQSRASRVYSADCDNNYVISDIPVALCGVRDLIVVEKDGVLLICRRGRSQEVRTVVELIEERGDVELL